jgi:hypothetical protein
MDKKKVIWEAHHRGLHDGFINSWMGVLDDILEDLSQELRIFEYGAQHSKFLEFMEIACPLKEGLGIVMPVDNQENLHTWPTGKTQHLKFLSESQVQPNQTFDIGLSQEVFSLIPDLTKHASFIWNILSPTGVCYSTFGWHATNPYIAKQKVLRNKKGLPFYMYTLDDVVNAFHAQGFEVGFKRLTLPYFMIYDTHITPTRYGGVEDMINCQQDHKVLFSFRKWEAVHG